MLELTEHLDRKPAQLSGGQRQRVAMGRAIVRDADAFLFDEPLSNLDAKLRGQMRTEISRIQDRLGITTVYVTHDQIEAMTLGDRVAVLRKGVLQQVDVAPRAVRAAGQPVRGRLHRLAADELPAGVGRGRDAVAADRRHRRSTRDLAEQVEGHDVLIAGIRPEHFEDASLLDDAGAAEGARVHAPTIDVIEWLGSEQYAYIPFEAPARGHAPARRAGRRARQRADPHPAGRDARRREPDRGRAPRPSCGSTPAGCTSSTPQRATTSRTAGASTARR